MHAFSAPLAGMLHVWGQLIEAMHGRAGLGRGGDICEIYAYNLQPYRPSCHNSAVLPTPESGHQYTAHIEVGKGAYQTLRQLVMLFEQQYEVVVAHADGDRFLDLGDVEAVFNDRVQLKVWTYVAEYEAFERMQRRQKKKQEREFRL